MRSISSFRILKGLAVAIVTLIASSVIADDSERVLTVKDSVATQPEEMKRYVELIEHTSAKIEMLPIPGGKLAMGSPESEPDRRADEGPVHPVELAPFWMAKYETSGCPTSMSSPAK